MQTGSLPGFVALLLLLTSVAVSPGPAEAQNEPRWPVKGKLLGKDDRKSEDVSGIACAADAGFPRTCLLIDDNVQSAQLVTLKDGELVVGESIRLIDDKHEGKPLELDGEGVAYANGFFYVIGSHGHPRDRNKELRPTRDAAKIRARIAASSQLIRLRIDAASGQVLELTRTKKLREFITADPTLRPFVDRRLETNGVTIEGIAIRSGRRLFAGFRGPVLNKSNDRAAILSVSLGALFEGQVPDSELHLLRLGQGRGVRDLAPFADGMLVLAGPTADAKGRYSVYWWDVTTDTPRLLKDLPTFKEDGKELKPEAILPLDQTSTGLRVLLMFDGAREGGPRAIKIAKP